MSYYLEDHPNHTLAQYGWPRTRVSGVIGVHTTESGVFPAGSDPGAENTASYISVRNTHGSYHALADWDTRIKLVRPRYAAWADVTNNAHALSVSGAMNAARWRDLTPERAAGIVRNMGLAAAELVKDAIADGLLDSAPPARRITAQQAIDGTAAGFYGHGETNPGTRYDPGQNFDWNLFLATYAAAINGVLPQSKEWWDMAEIPKAQLDQIAKAVWQMAGIEGEAGQKQTMWRTIVDMAKQLRVQASQLQTQSTTIDTLVKLVSQGSDLTEEQITNALKLAFLDVLQKDEQ